MWNRDTTSLWGCAFVQLILFDIIWCLQTTFSSFSIPEVYVNTILVALLCILPWMLTGKKWGEYLFLFILDGLLISNLMYSRTYNSAIPLESYLLAGNLSDFTASVVDSMRLIDLLLPLSTLACIIFLSKGEKGLQKDSSAINATLPKANFALRLKQYGITTLIVFLISAIQVMCRGGWQKAFERLQNANYYTCAVPMYTIFGNLIHQGMQTQSPFTSKMQADICQWMKQQPAYQPLSDSIASKKTLIVIFCESLESWVINKKVEGQVITPNLNASIADAHTLCPERAHTSEGRTLHRWPTFGQHRPSTIDERLLCHAIPWHHLSITSQGSQGKIPLQVVLDDS